MLVGGWALTGRAAIISCNSCARVSLPFKMLSSRFSPLFFVKPFESNTCSQSPYEMFTPCFNIWTSNGSEVELSFKLSRDLGLVLIPDPIPLGSWKEKKSDKTFLQWLKSMTNLKPCPCLFLEKQEGEWKIHAHFNQFWGEREVEKKGASLCKVENWSQVSIFGLFFLTHSGWSRKEGSERGDVRPINQCLCMKKTR